MSGCLPAAAGPLVPFDLLIFFVLLSFGGNRKARSGFSSSVYHSLSISTTLSSTSFTIALPSAKTF